MPPARPAPTPAPRLTHPACDGPCDLVAPSPTRGGQTLRVGLRRNGKSRHDAKALVMSMMLICALPTVGELYSTLHQSDLEILEAFESAKQYCFAFASGGTDGKGQSGSDTLCVILDKLAAQARIGGWHDLTEHNLVRSNGELYSFYSFRVRGDQDKEKMENLFTKHAEHGALRASVEHQARARLTVANTAAAPSRYPCPHPRPPVPAAPAVGRKQRRERPPHPFPRVGDGAMAHTYDKYKYVMLPGTYLYTAENLIPFLDMAMAMASHTSKNSDITGKAERPTTNYPLARVGDGATMHSSS